MNLLISKKINDINCLLVATVKEYYTWCDSGLWRSWKIGSAQGHSIVNWVVLKPLIKVS